MPSVSFTTAAVAAVARDGPLITITRPSFLSQPLPANVNVYLIRFSEPPETEIELEVSV